MVEDHSMSDDVSAGDMIDPTPLQHTMGKVICTMMRAALPTASPSPPLSCDIGLPVTR